MQSTQATPHQIAPTKKHLLALKFIQWTRHLSFKNAWLLAGLLTPFIWQWSRRTKQTTLDNINLCLPNLTQQEQNEIAQQSLKHTISLALESGQVWIKPLADGIKAIRHIAGLEVLEQRAPTTGIIFLLPHLGNWEMANQFIAPRAKVVAMYKPHKNPLLDQLIRDARMRAGVDMVPTTRSGVAKILRHLKRGGVTVILPDQVPDAGSGVLVNFFAQPAYTGTLVPKLAQATGARIAGLSCIRSTDGRFDIYLNEAPESVYQTDLTTATQAMNHFVERLIRPFYEQYQWGYKRFKRK